MSEEELTYLQKLQESNCVVVDSDTTRYKNNQLSHGIALDDYKVPYAHGSRVFNDYKIHFYTVPAHRHASTMPYSKFVSQTYKCDDGNHAYFHMFYSVLQHVP